MTSKNDDPSIDYNSMEKWLEIFFLDPLTSYLDHTQFRVDLFETETDLIVEAMLTNYDSSDITVYLQGNELKIKAEMPAASSDSNNLPKIRTVSFPFQVTDKKVMALFHKGILEIYISKIESGPGNDRFITLP
jgi:HSP20 family molecular chaperone IbpA